MGDMVATELLSWIGMGCWLLCFWWMHRISKRQDAMLEALARQAERIERVAREEHEIIKEVHPAIEQIRDGICEQDDSPR